MVTESLQRSEAVEKAVIFRLFLVYEATGIVTASQNEANSSLAGYVTSSPIVTGAL